ncbi:odorant receptor 93 isoform X1 [Nasonia vitripennis]|uniref:Odorant receptor n=1 Tax=Nasonia vitripennis TaxID=7425 RepID=A0A7M7T9A3_NASVI|nr:odorant receptor 93 [Nasonia vitripennis]XP_031784324.1 odorant receptor 93 isoform X1 [Nasonia vitripennis]
MHVLPESFMMFTCAGVWQPVHWSACDSRFLLYKLYTLFSIVLVYTLTISELMGAILLTQSLEDFTDISFLLISTISVCCKIASIIARRDRVIHLTEMLLEVQCIPKNVRELEITRKFDKIARFTALSCIVLAEATVVVMSTGPLFQKAENRTLPFKSWLPYDSTTTPCTFWLSYVHQTAAIVLCATVNVANDSLICGFMTHSCSQLELLNRRLLELPRAVKLKMKKLPRRLMCNVEAMIVSRHVKHHVHIFKFAENINVIFTPVILVQFCMSSIVLSLSVYQLAVRSANGIQFITMVMYLTCMLVQFFMYCWFGNEVTLKSVEFGQAIYNIEWTSLQVQTSKDLMIMMIRAKRPIIMSSGALVTLSIKSFTSILKASYSTFNVLQRSSHN